MSPEITLRDYLAAHAPHPVPDWFEAPQKPLPAAVYECPEGACAPTRCEHGECDMTNYPARTAVTLGNKMRRETAWRYAYADAMLEERLHHALHSLSPEAVRGLLDAVDVLRRHAVANAPIFVAERLTIAARALRGAIALFEHALDDAATVQPAAETETAPSPAPPEEANDHTWTCPKHGLQPNPHCTECHEDAHR